MKIELRVNYLQLKKQNAGFTLIELLVVIIIIGILSAIALPSFLNQAVKARQTEAKTNIGVINRAQQVHYLENNRFAYDTGSTTAINELGIGIKNSDNYHYTAEFITALNVDVVNKAQAQRPDIKGYAGAVFASAGLTLTILCENKTANLDPPAKPTSPHTCDSDQNRV